MILGCLGWEPPLYISLPVNQGFLFHLASQIPLGGREAMDLLYRKINAYTQKVAYSFR